MVSIYNIIRSVTGQMLLFQYGSSVKIYKFVQYEWKYRLKILHFENDIRKATFQTQYIILVCEVQNITNCMS